MRGGGTGVLRGRGSARRKMGGVKKRRGAGGDARRTPARGRLPCPHCHVRQRAFENEEDKHAARQGFNAHELSAQADAFAAFQEGPAAGDSKVQAAHQFLHVIIGPSPGDEGEAAKGLVGLEHDGLILPWPAGRGTSSMGAARNTAPVLGFRRSEPGDKCGAEAGVVTRSQWRRWRPRCAAFPQRAPTNRPKHCNYVFFYRKIGAESTFCCVINAWQS
ncbi:MAG: hypothetical protein ACI93G_001490 [Hyphomonas sp.]